ncbi:MAG TPA: YbdD/YjiX family protein, partial [Steroidobacteraceae bacterium]|nr:YbdD/YjiX family protein [Steroidobacteraceae bacterium]
RPLQRALAGAVRWLRALSGDDAYERYLTHHARAHEGPPLSRRAFYRERESRKWSGISRCC